MELFEHIRREHFIEGKSVRRIAREQRVHRRDVRRAIVGLPPPERKFWTRRATKVGPHEKIIDEWLLADRDVRPKQRHTARQIWKRLCRERGFDGAESTIRRYVGHRRRELGLQVREIFIEQEYQPGEEAQVDFGEADITIGGIDTTVFLLLVRCCYSGRTQVIAFRRQTQQSLLEGLARSFEMFGGVFSRLRFDNLGAAVKKVLRGRQRKETDRFVACRSHYLFKADFCRPGKEGAHEKGGVEGEVGRFRRNHLVPRPSVEGMEELNTYLAQCCLDDESRTMAHRHETVGKLWSACKAKLRPLPTERFDVTEILEPRVDRKSRVQAKQNFYSVPTAYAGRRVVVRVDTDTVTVISGGTVIAIHERLNGTHGESLQLDHYLEWLHRKPRAFAHSKVLGQARRRGAFPDCYDRLWDGLKDRYGDNEGTRQLIDVLMLLRTSDPEEVTMAVELALSHHCIDAAAVACLLRQIQHPAAEGHTPFTDIGPLLAYERPEPDIDRYDLWLNMEVH